MAEPRFVEEADLVQTLAFYDLLGRPNIPWAILVAVSVLLFVSAVALWPVSLLYTRRRPASSPSRTPRVARTLALITAMLNLTFVVALIVMVMRSSADWLLALIGLMFGVPAQVMPWLIIPTVTAILTLGLLVFTVLAWKRRYWTLIARIHYSCVTLFAATFAGWVMYWLLR